MNLPCAALDDSGLSSRARPCARLLWCPETPGFIMTATPLFLLSLNQVGSISQMLFFIFFFCSKIIPQHCLPLEILVIHKENDSVAFMWLRQWVDLFQTVVLSFVLPLGIAWSAKLFKGLCGLQLDITHTSVLYGRFNSVDKWPTFMEFLPASAGKSRLDRDAASLLVLLVVLTH